MSSSRCSGRPMRQIENQSKQKRACLVIWSRSFMWLLFQFHLGDKQLHRLHEAWWFCLFVHSYSVISDVCFAVPCWPVSTPECQLCMCPVRKLLLFLGLPGFSHWPWISSTEYVQSLVTFFPGLCWLHFIFFILLVRISTSGLLLLFSSVSGNEFQRASHPPGIDLIH